MLNLRAINDISVEQGHELSLSNIAFRLIKLTENIQRGKPATRG